MDTIALVENRIEEGQHLLDLLEEDRISVRAACWVKRTDLDRWIFYIATPIWDEKGPLEAYRKITPALRTLGNDWLTGSDVTLVGEKHPLVNDTREFLRRFPHRTPIQSPLSLIGGIPVEEIYVYTLGKVKVPIYGLYFRDHPGGGLTLSFEPYSPDSKLVEEKDGKRKEYRAETGMDWIVAAPESSTLERDEYGKMVLAWNLNGRRVRSSPNEIWSLANLGRQGFRFVSQPA